MYKQNIFAYKKSKYAKASSNLLAHVFCAEDNYVSPDGKTCDRALSRGNMPLQAKVAS